MYRFSALGVQFKTPVPRHDAVVAADKVPVETCQQPFGRHGLGAWGHTRRPRQEPAQLIGAHMLPKRVGAYGLMEFGQLGPLRFKQQ
jgi:hypothetical protein